MEVHMPCLDDRDEVDNDCFDEKSDHVVPLSPSYVSANFLCKTKLTFNPTESATQESTAVGSHRFIAPSLRVSSQRSRREMLTCIRCLETIIYRNQS